MLELIICAALEADIKPEINKGDHIAGLVRTDRAPRTWFTKIGKVPVFTAKTMPGRETFFYYEWVLADGKTVTKVESRKLAHVPDRRSFVDAHPNAPVMTAGLGLVGNVVGNIIGGFVKR